MSEFLKNGVYYTENATQSGLKRMPFAFDVQYEGDNPFAPNMPRGLYYCSGWGAQAHEGIDYADAIGWKNIPKGTEYFILSGNKNCYAVTAKHARSSFRALFSSGVIQDIVSDVAHEVYKLTYNDEIEEIESDYTMEEVSGWDEEAA